MPSVQSTWGAVDISDQSITLITDINMYWEVPVSRTSILSHAARLEPAAADHDLIAALQDAAETDSRLVLRGPDGHDILLPESLTRFVVAAVHDLAAGHAVLALPVETRLTPAETAQLLGYSRPFVSRLLDEGDIPSAHLPGSTHRTVRLADVLEFQARREHNAEGRRRITEIVEEHDLPY
jgi:excisionase family DNA binding protein